MSARRRDPLGALNDGEAAEDQLGTAVRPFNKDVETLWGEIRPTDSPSPLSQMSFDDGTERTKSGGGECCLKPLPRRVLQPS
jgi:hypothetical protein